MSDEPIRVEIEPEQVEGAIELPEILREIHRNASQEARRARNRRGGAGREAARRFDKVSELAQELAEALEDIDQ